jgi:hypothetical protein
MFDIHGYGQELNDQEQECVKGIAEPQVLLRPHTAVGRYEGSIGMSGGQLGILGVGQSSVEQCQPDSFKTWYWMYYN